MAQGDASSTSVVGFDGIVVIVGGGPVDRAALDSLVAAGAHLVGADGGADVLADAGHVPELIVGDFDSLRHRDWPETTRLMPITEQLSTDFEKAIYSTQAQVTVALGMTGGRFDHTLSAIDSLMRHAGTRHILLVDEEDVTLALNGPFAFAVEAGDRVSIYPLEPVRFTASTGLDYPLDDLLLAPGMRSGTSNAAPDGPFEIVPETDARWLLILPRRYMSALIERLLEPG